MFGKKHRELLGSIIDLSKKIDHHTAEILAQGTNIHSSAAQMQGKVMERYMIDHAFMVKAISNLEDLQKIDFKELFCLSLKMDGKLYSLTEYYRLVRFNFSDMLRQRLQILLLALDKNGCKRTNRELVEKHINELLDEIRKEEIRIDGEHTERQPGQGATAEGGQPQDIAEPVEKGSQE